MRMTELALLAVLGVMALVTAACGQAASAPADDATRVGLLEDCSTTEGWYEWDKERNKVAPRVKMESKDGMLYVHTNRGLLSGNFRKWEIEGVNPGSILRKDFGEVDLDKYHYFVVKVHSKGSGVFFGVNGYDTKAGYTTGTTVVDLKDYDNENIHGKRPVRLEMDLHDNLTTLVVEEIKLVSELTDEEKKHFIDRGLTIRAENLKAQPNHNLTQLLARAKTAPSDGQEMAIFRDTATGGIVTRLTSCGANDYVAEGAMWSADGAAFKFRSKGRRELGGVPVYFVGEGKVVGSGRSDWALWHPTDPNIMVLVSASNRVNFTVSLWDRTTGKAKEVAKFTTPQVGGYNEVKQFTNRDRLVIAFRETPHVFAVDLKTGEVEHVELSTRLKDAGWDDVKGRIHWANCYTFEGRWRNVKTGEEGNSPSYTVGHGCGGKNGSVGSFGTHLKLFKSGGFKDPFRPGDELKIWANWQNEVTTDYGTLTDDNEWIFTNGTHGDVASQHVMVPSDDTGAVLRLTRYFTKFSWESPTYSRPSPDYTKVIFCDNYGGTVPASLMMVYSRRPDAPTNVKLDGSKLTWSKPRRSAELAGYHVYASDKSGRDFVRLTDKPLTDTSYSVADAKKYYVVTAVEHSKLESLYSQEQSAAGAKTFYFEAEDMKLTAPARRFFDGSRNGFQVVRINAQSPEEKADLGRVAIDTPVELNGFTLWALVQGKGRLVSYANMDDWNGDQALARSRHDDWISRADVDAEQYTWVRLRKLESGKRVVLASFDDNLKIDTIMVTSDEDFEPKVNDPRDGAPPAAVAGLKASFDAEKKQVKLSWQASDAKDLHHYDVFVGTTSDFACDNSSLIRSVLRPELTDEGMAAGQKLYYKVVAVDGRFNASAPAVVEVDGLTIDS